MSKIGLVELTDAEQAKVKDTPSEELSMADIDAILASEGAQAPPAQRPAPRPAPSPAPSAPAATPSAASGATGISEGDSFEAIYAIEGTPEAAFSAEKLLRLLDGLKAMDPPTRKAAVLAMDAADDEWTVADAVLDAERKSQVLHRRVAQLASDLEAMTTDAAAEKQRREEYLAKATATLREKIAELEQTLQDEAATIAAQKAEIDGKLEAARAAFGREKARLEGEAGRLATIPNTFAIPRTP
ncbi:MAG: hypothetical protein AAF645_18355 [Myxococcota bacterium]